MFGVSAASMPYHHWRILILDKQSCSGQNSGVGQVCLADGWVQYQNL
jgi:hypothetical protein